MRQKFCRGCGQWHELNEWPIGCMPRAPIAASDLPSPHFVSDSIDIQSMHDGQHYTSKSKLRSAYRAAGVVEIGNEKPQPIVPPAPDRKGIRKALKEAYQQHSA